MVKTEIEYYLRNKVDDAKRRMRQSYIDFATDMNRKIYKVKTFQNRADKLFRWLYKKSNENNK